MHVAYHKSLNPKIVPTEEFHELLLTDEWFDRPQQSLEGNSDETKRLLQGFSKGHQSGLRQDVRAGIYSDIGLRTGVSGSKKIEDDASEQSSESNSSQHIDKKRRGRPKRQLELLDEQSNS